jgi:hypothetical protein
MKRRSASVERQPNGEYLVQTYSKTANGFSVMDGLPVRLSAQATAVELGQAVLDALNRRREGLPPYDYKKDEPDREFLKFVGATSYARYCRGVRSVSVDADLQMQEISVRPARSAGRHGGFSGIMEREVTFVFESVEQVGQAVLEAFEFATAMPGT